MTFGSGNARRAFGGGQDIASVPSTAPLYARLEDLLVSGGDSRITLERDPEKCEAVAYAAAGQLRKIARQFNNPEHDRDPKKHDHALARRANKYGCVPFPQDDMAVFSSSTASCISERAYARANRSRLRLLAEAAIHGVGEAFQSAIAAARTELKQVLRLPQGTEVVFAASGTDAQLSALFLARALMKGSMTVIVVGADQTGSGTIHTARGCHFDSHTAQDITVTRGGVIAALGENLRSVEIPFAGADGKVRSGRELDGLVRAAVSDAARRGDKILLQAMDASKLGWRGPSLDCLAGIAARWPGQVQIVIDACQLRCGRSRLAAYLDQGFMVLVTGSKFFAGPALSGALLTPAGRDRALRAITATAYGLQAYASQFDWPEDWPLRKGFSAMPNYGLWLRWDAALEEMAVYYAVPDAFRGQARIRLAQEISGLLNAAPFLTVMDRPERHCGTIFPFLLHRQGRVLPLAGCTMVYRALTADISGLLPAEVGPDERMLAAHRCLIGQPVRVGAEAVLRIAISARQIHECGEGSVKDAVIAAESARLEKAIGKIGLILRHFETIAGHFENA